MNTMAIVLSVTGGILIGLAVTFMLLFNGRVTGISGIISGTLALPRNDTFWRFSFIAGLLVGGIILRVCNPDAFINTTGRTLGTIAFAGFLVGYGTVMGGGCTSGHGVCGLSRLSVRSVLATGTFMVFGFLTATLVGMALRGHL